MLTIMGLSLKPIPSQAFDAVMPVDRCEVTKKSVCEPRFVHLMRTSPTLRAPSIWLLANDVISEVVDDKIDLVCDDDDVFTDSLVNNEEVVVEED